MAWAEIVVKSLTPCSGFLPACIVALKQVAKVDFLGNHEAECRVVNFKIAG